VAESAQHRALVRGLVNWMKSQGVSVSNAAGGLALPDPRRIGRHEPDALGKKDAVTWIGEAKVGTDLYDPHSQEQLRDFSRRVMTKSGKRCPFVLCVPKGWEQEARKAVRQAGGSTANLTLIS
jgi:hypothetical protein